MLEPTYPKRAKGLVKNGRARYVGENTICILGNRQARSSDHREERDMNHCKNNLGYIRESVERVLKSLDEPIVIPPGVPDTHHLYIHLYNQRAAAQKQALDLMNILIQAEQTVHEQPDFEYLRKQIDDLSEMAKSGSDTNDSGEYLKTLQRIADLCDSYMELCKESKRQALMDRIVNHAWIDQGNKVRMFEQMKYNGDAKNRPPKSSQHHGESFEAFRIPNFDKQIKKLEQFMTKWGESWSGSQNDDES